jgi:hypothetical protein
MKYLGSTAGFATAVITLINNTALIFAASYRRILVMAGVRRQRVELAV